MNGKNDKIILNLKDLGAEVKAKRNQLGLKQADAAGLCKVGTRFLSDLENGKSSLHVGKILDVLNGLGLMLYVGEKGRLA
jgi:HTH-type transcriptional regulator/antitoxin HipB